MAEKITASNTLDTLRKHILVDGFPIVVDYDKSKGPYLYDEATGKRFFDFFSFYASNPIGINHPKMKDAEFLRKLYKVAVIKPTLADIYTPEYAEFVAAFAANAGRGHFHKYFFIEGGALAVENALKTAFDWKVQKNIAKGKGEKGQQIIHFKQAFHGRSGYTMSLTNTEPKKIQWFPKFDWPRITNPKLKFPITPASLAETEKLEQQAIAEINAAFDKNPDDIAGIIIEPIQSEGGDNHFRPEFLRKLREICDTREALLIFDEVQTGFGLTGTFWAWEQLGVKPDVLAFGKKSQTCGIAVAPRVDEVDSVFKISSRINSTFGGNLTDMVRCTQYLKIMAEEHLAENAAARGKEILAGLEKLAQKFKSITNIRGRGLIVAYDLPTAEERDKYRRTAYDLGLMVLACGERSIRLRPVLDLTAEQVQEALGLFEQTFKKIYG